MRRTTNIDVEESEFYFKLDQIESMQSEMIKTHDKTKLLKQSKKGRTHESEKFKNIYDETQTLINQLNLNYKSFMGNHSFFLLRCELKRFKMIEKQIHAFQSTQRKYMDDEIVTVKKKSQTLLAAKPPKKAKVANIKPTKTSRKSKKQRYSETHDTSSLSNLANVDNSRSPTINTTTLNANSLIESEQFDDNSDHVTHGMTQVENNFDHLKLSSQITSLNCTDALFRMDTGVCATQNQTQSNVLTATSSNVAVNFDEFETMTQQFTTSTQYSQPNQIKSNQGQPIHLYKSARPNQVDFTLKKIDLKRMRTTDIYSIRTFKESELVHLNKMPKNFWKTIVSHTFWYDKFDDWD